jgi:hypothetical protein
VSFSFEEGYVPQSIPQIMDALRVGINAQFGTTYTTETFVGTGYYKYMYALAQRIQEGEIRTSEVFLKLQDYIKLTNERISRPVVTNQGLIDALERSGFIASVKKPVVGERGELRICVDTDDTAPDYEAKRLEICTLIKDSSAAGVVTIGTEEEEIVLSNGQAFDFKFNLPTRVPTELRLTLTLSQNNQVVIGNPDAVKDLLLGNIALRYRLGRNFEPQNYFTVVDAPWCSKVLLEYSFDGDVWFTDVYVTDYDELLTFSLSDTIVIEE